MAKILTEKYSDKNFLFYTNRLLRLYPIYWSVIFLFLIYFILIYSLGINNVYLKSYSDLINNASVFDYLILLVFILSNIFMLGLDWSKFIRIDFLNSNLAFTSKWNAITPNTSDFIPNAPAWTIGLELTFYIFAPYIIRLKSKYILFGIVLSVFLRIIFYYLGYYNDPFSYRFFPFEIAFFLLGVVAYRVLNKYRNRIEAINKSYSYFILFVIILTIITFGKIPVQTLPKMFIFYSVIFLSIPILFSSFRLHKLDKFLGEFSYPIYITHWLLITIFKDFGYSISTSWETILFCFYTFLLSLVLWYFIGRNVEKFRTLRFKKLKVIF